MKTKPKIKQSFDKGARNYESNCDIQRLICHQLVNFFLERKEKIILSVDIKGLDLGAGNGILSIELLKFIKFEKLHLIDFSDKMLDFDMAIKSFLSEKMYRNKKVLKKAQNGEKIIKSLFNTIKKKPHKFIKKKAFLGNLKERCICDFIAGMTDRYAINVYNSLK